MRICAAAVLVAGMIANVCAASPWQNIGPGGGGWVPCLAVSPANSQVVYAGCDVGGFYRSLDAGENWRIHNEGLRDVYVEVIVPHPRDPNTLYIGTEGGVHRSTDGGVSWELLGDGFPPRQRWSFSAPIGALAIDPAKPQVIYAGIGRPRWGTSGQGTVYRSTDGGSHWVLANPGGGGMDTRAIVNDLLIHPTTAAIFAATDRGLYRSDDQGKTWTRQDKGLPTEHIGRVALCRSRPDVMYLSVMSAPGKSPWRGGVYRSNDGGNTWAACTSGLGTTVGKPGEPGPMTSNIDRLVVHPDNPDIVYAGDTSWVTAGVYRTLDGGNTWKNLTRNTDRGWISAWGPTVMGLAMDPSSPDCLYFSTSGHVFRTTDQGEHWKPIYTRQVSVEPSPRWAGTGLETTCLNSIAVNPRQADRLYLCYMDIGLIQSTDGGRSFAQTVQGMRYQGNTFRVAFDPDDPQIVYAGTGEWSSNHGDVCRSDDGGMTWRVVGKPETGLPDGQTRHLLIAAGGSKATRRIFVGVEGAGVFCSEDSGAAWVARNRGLSSKAIRGLAAHPRDAQTLFALFAEGEGSSGGLYRSVNGGMLWQRMGEMVWPDAKALVICPSDPQRLYIAAREKTMPDGKLHPGGVFASADGGATWKHVLDDHFIEALAVDPGNADIVYAGGNDHPFHDDALGRGVLGSQDGGKSWVSLNDPSLTVRKVVSLTLDPHRPTRLYAGTAGNGVFVRELSATDRPGRK